MSASSLQAVQNDVLVATVAQTTLHVHRSYLRHDIQDWPRGHRCRRQRVESDLRGRAGVDDPLQRGSGRLHPAVHSHRPGNERDRAGKHHAQLGSFDRQRRRLRLWPVSQWGPNFERYRDELHLHRSRLWDDLLLGVDAYDAAGNRSTTAALNATTSACTGGDVTPPTAPTGLATSGISQTSITLSWIASTDNVGVAGLRPLPRRSPSALDCHRHELHLQRSDLRHDVRTRRRRLRRGREPVDALDDQRNDERLPAAPPSSANLYLSPSARLESVHAVQPCASLARAYSLAQLGQTVELAGGMYPAVQTLSGSKSGTGVITFRPAIGATSNFSSDLNLNGQNHIEFQNMSFDNWYAKYVSDITFRNVSTRFFFVRVSDNVRILGGSVGPSQDGTSPTIGNYAGEPVSTNITVDGVLFHDIGRQKAPGAHVECLFLQESSGVVIRNSKFTRCDIMDLYVSPVQGGPTASNVVIENNWFDQPTDGGYYAFNLHPDSGTVPHNFTFRFNSVDSSIYLYPGFNYDNVIVDSNVGRITTCDTPGITYRYNVWTNQTCGSTDKIAPSGFMGSFNLHLASGAAAINAGNPTSYPATDIDGVARPRAGRPTRAQSRQAEIPHRPGQSWPARPRLTASDQTCTIS